MSIRILYFAGLRESLGAAGEDFALAPGLDTLGALRRRLCERGGAWEALAEGRSLRMAVNQRMADAGAALRDGDEVAFFPPVTGG